MITQDITSDFGRQDNVYMRYIYFSKCTVEIGTGSVIRRDLI